MTDLFAIRDEWAALRPPGGFPVLLFDCPWEHVAWSDKGLGKSPCQHYDVMSIGDIYCLPIDALAADDCAIFMWLTWPHMMLWHRVVEAWRCRYSGLAWEWIKYNPKSGKFAFGQGKRTRKNLEPCILVYRGNPKFLGDRTIRDFMFDDDLLIYPAREHSRKPDEQYSRIEAMYAGPYAEIFGRTTRPGWVSWGNQAGLFDASMSVSERETL